MGTRRLPRSPTVALPLRTARPIRPWPYHYEQPGKSDRGLTTTNSPADQTVALPLRTARPIRPWPYEQPSRSDHGIYADRRDRGIYLTNSGHDRGIYFMPWH